MAAATRLKVKGLVSSGVMLALVGAAVFIPAGRVDLPFVWAALGLLAVYVVLALASIDPDLMAERMRPEPGGLDRRIQWHMAPFFLAHLVLAGLDAGRFHWSRVPVALQIVGLAGIAASLALGAWAVHVNRFFSPVVRIQSERGHHLVVDGPYRFVRHPGYAGSLAMLVFSGFAWGSYVSLIPHIGCAVILLRRTWIEDRFLHEHLPGYANYAATTRWRLIPGVW